MQSFIHISVAGPGLALLQELEQETTWQQRIRFISFHIGNMYDKTRLPRKSVIPELSMFQKYCSTLSGFNYGRDGVH